jgi:ABC-type phosphate transport system permease subunit
MFLDCSYCLKSDISFIETHPWLALAAATIALTAAVAAIAIKLKEQYNSTSKHSLNFKVMEFYQNYPYIPVVSALFCIALSLFYLPLGLTCAIPLGIYGAFCLKIDYNLGLQEKFINDGNTMNSDKRLIKS